MCGWEEEVTVSNRLEFIPVKGTDNSFATGWSPSATIPMLSKAADFIAKLVTSLPIYHMSAFGQEVSLIFVHNERGHYTTKRNLQILLAIFNSQKISSRRHAKLFVSEIIFCL